MLTPCVDARWLTRLFTDQLTPLFSESNLLRVK